MTSRTVSWLFSSPPFVQLLQPLAGLSLVLVVGPVWAAASAVGEVVAIPVPVSEVFSI